MRRPNHHDRKPGAPQKESFWFTGPGITLIVLSVCLVCVPIYIGLDALGAFTFTGLAVIFVGFWAIVAIIGWLLPSKPRS